MLNLYAGIGGNRKLWTDCEVTAVELNPEVAKVYQSYFPEDEIIVGDAHQYLLDHFKEFDFIWSSPPCPTHSRINTDTIQKPRFPDMTLYEEIIFLGNNWYSGKFVIENVIPYYEPLKPPTARIGRHLFWANFKIPSLQVVNEKPIADQDGKERYGFSLSQSKMKGDKRKALRNLVDPEIGGGIFNAAKGIINHPKTNQLSIVNDQQ